MKALPTREDIIGLVAEEIYSGRILNNSHRGDVVEMMVLAALGTDWKHVGLGWHPWDLERRSGDDRVRVQVKQIAARQLWGPTKTLQVKFGWKKNAPFYYSGDPIESEGWFCELFIVGIHRVNDERADQVDPAQWEFLVIPTSDLERGQDSMLLSKALERWQPVSWSALREAVDRTIPEDNRR